jgi:hypothetical protein
LDTQNKERILKAAIEKHQVTSKDEPIRITANFLTETLFIYLFIFLFLLLFICAYKAWFISLPCPHPLPYHPLHPLPLPSTPSIPSRNYFALISNFVVERV